MKNDKLYRPSLDYVGQSKDFLYRGKRFRVRIEHDDNMVEPWKEHDGHGIVSDWTIRDKAPGELVLSDNGRHKRYYDFAATCRLARKDGWGFLPGDLVCDRFAHSGNRKYRAIVAGRLDLTAYGKDQNTAISALYALHRATFPSARAYAAGAVMKDFQRLQAWCNDHWTWCGVVVECLTTGATKSIWGIESDAGQYLWDTAEELAEELIRASKVAA